jgi:hypothetical protein
MSKQVEMSCKICGLNPSAPSCRRAVKACYQVAVHKMLADSPIIYYQVSFCGKGLARVSIYRTTGKIDGYIPCTGLIEYCRGPLHLHRIRPECLHKNKPETFLPRLFSELPHPRFTQSFLHAYNSTFDLFFNTVRTGPKNPSSLNCSRPPW